MEDRQFVTHTHTRTRTQGYDLAYREMAERGMRVLALASRTLTSSEEDTGESVGPYKKD